MKFVLTPEEAQPAARAVAGYLRRRRLRVRVESSPWSDSPYRTTLRAKERGMQILVECQGALTYTPALKALRSWLHANRHHAELYLATTREAHTQAGQITELRKDGVGLFLVGDDHGVTEALGASNPALMVLPDPTLGYGSCAREVSAALVKFNGRDRKDGLRG